MKPAAPIASPCVEVCNIDEARGYCWGCFRTLDEIASWLEYSPEQRADLMLDLERRRLEAKAQRKKLNDGADLPEDDPEDNRLYDLCFDLEKEIAKAPAHTAAGIAVKIRLLQESHEQGWDAYYADGFRTALEALERLGGAAAFAHAARPASPGAAAVQTPEPIRALFDQSVALNDEANAVSLEAEAASDPTTAKALREKSDRFGVDLSAFGAFF